MEIPLTQQEIIEYNDFIGFLAEDEQRKLNEKAKNMTKEDINNLSFDDKCDLTPAQIREKLKEFRRLKKEKDESERNINIDDLTFE